MKLSDRARVEHLRVRRLTDAYKTEMCRMYMLVFLIILLLPEERGIFFSFLDKLVKFRGRG